MRAYWQSLSLVRRIRLIRYVLPIILIPIVMIYQFQVAFRLELLYGHPLHYAAEIAFYSFVGPIVTWLTLIWVENRLEEKDALEREVRARTLELAGLTAASQDGILSLDHTGRITSWNQVATALFGFTADEMLGTPVSRILPQFSTLFQEPAGGRMTWSVETTAVGRDQRKINVDLTLTRMEGENGASPVSLVIMRDITTRIERAAILEEERGRISRDLHDGVAQTLYFLALKADITREQMVQDPDRARENLVEIGQQARRAIRDVRRAIFGLRPLDWREGEFLSALTTFASDFGQEVSLNITVETSADPSVIPNRFEPTLFRLVQESLNNVAKHALAQSVQIEIQHDADRSRLVVVIRDDGQGFSLDDVHRGLGLRQMEQRIQAIGGEFHLESIAGRGTEIRAEFPLEGVLI